LGLEKRHRLVKWIGGRQAGGTRKRAGYFIFFDDHLARVPTSQKTEVEGGKKYPWRNNAEGGKRTDRGRGRDSKLFSSGKDKGGRLAAGNGVEGEGSLNPTGTERGGKNSGRRKSSEGGSAKYSQQKRVENRFLGESDPGALARIPGR